MKPQFQLPIPSPQTPKLNSSAQVIANKFGGAENTVRGNHTLHTEPQATNYNTEHQSPQPPTPNPQPPTPNSRSLGGRELRRAARFVPQNSGANEGALGLQHCIRICLCSYMLVQIQEIKLASEQTIKSHTRPQLPPPPNLSAPPLPPPPPLGAWDSS